jgi:hemolysin-activating ACP:hemolysin acyltransferase
MKTEPDKNKKPDAAAGAAATAQAPHASKPNGAGGPQIANAPPIPVPAAEGAALSPEEAKGRADYSHRIMQAFGSIVAIYMRSKTHRELRLAEVENIIGPAIATSQFSLAEAAHKENGLITPVAVVLWASLSDALDQEIAAHPEKPLALKATDWKTGDNVWVVEALGDQRVIGSIMSHLQQGTWKGRSVKMRSKAQDGKIGVHVVAQKADGG